MKPGNLKSVDIALFSRKITAASEYQSLPAEEQMECENALTAAMSLAGSYTGLDMKTTEFEDLAYAVEVLAAEMIDQRQITVSAGVTNPTVKQILDLHSTNLLPSQ